MVGGGRGVGCTALIVAVAIGVAGDVRGVGAEGGEPPRIVLVQTAGVGAERRTQILSSNGSGFRTVPSPGPSGASIAPEAVLAVQASQSRPVAGGTDVETASPTPTGADRGADARPVGSPREGLARSGAETRTAHETGGLAIWQLALLALTGLAGLGVAIYGMAWTGQPPYVVRVVPAPPATPRRPPGRAPRDRRAAEPDWTRTRPSTTRAIVGTTRRPPVA